MKGKKGIFSDSSDESDETSTSTSFYHIQSNHADCQSFSSVQAVCASVSQSSDLVGLAHFNLTEDRSVQTDVASITEKKEGILTGWHFDIEAQILVECEDNCEAAGFHREVDIQLAPLKKELTIKI